MNHNYFLLLQEVVYPQSTHPCAILALFMVVLLTSGCINDATKQTSNEIKTWSEMLVADTLHDKHDYYFFSDTLHHTFDTRKTVHFNSSKQKSSAPPTAIKLEEPVFNGYSNGMVPLGSGQTHSILNTSSKRRLNSQVIPLEFTDIEINLTKRSVAKPYTYDAVFPFRIRQYTEVDGMITDNSKPVQDSSGVLWFSTKVIQSFDGVNNMAYTPANGVFTQPSHFTKDGQGGLWFTTDWSRKMMLFDGAHLRNSNIENVRIVGKDRSGKLFVHRDSILYELANNSLTPVATDNWLKFGIKQCIEGPNEEVLITGANGHLGVLGTDSLTTIQLGNKGRIQSLATGENNTIWLASDSGLIHLNGDHFQMFTKDDGLASNQIKELLKDRQGRLWISYGSYGIDVLNQGGVYHLDLATSYSDGYTFCKKNLFEDHLGNIWVNSAGEGLIAIDESAFKPLRLNNQSQFYKEIITFDQKIWCSTSKGIFIYDEATKKVLRHESLAKKLFGSDDLSIVEFQNDIWIAKDGYRMVCQLKGDSLFVHGRKQGVTKVISDMVVDSNGVLWLGGPEGLLSYDGKRFRDELPHINGAVNTLSLTKNKRVLVSHAGIGILHQKNNGWKILPVGSCFNVVPWTTQYLGDEIYVTSTWSNGVYILSDSILFHLNTTNGLGDAICPLLIEDGNQLWLGNFRNLQTISIANIRAYFTQKSDYLDIISIQPRDGLMHTFFPYHAGYSQDTARILLSNSAQILEVSKKTSSFSQKDNKVVLRWLEVKNKTYNFQLDQPHQGITWSETPKFSQFARDLELDYDFNQITIGFQYLDYSEPHELKYRYRIGNEEEWIETTTDNSATFTNLPPGDHHFEVQAFASDLHWSESTIFNFTVLPPWYRTNLAFVVYALLFGLIIMFVVRWRTAQLERDKEKLEKTVSDRTADLVEEKSKSEALLLNILPEEIAQELKAKGHADAKGYDLVSVIFTDFVGFTSMSAQLQPEEVVERINECFKGFDLIMEKYGIEKIKTIGDAYMAASGLPKPNPNSVENAILAALEMQEFINQRQQDFAKKGKKSFVMRLGVHTGPVVAGIVGVKKFQYDIWGDTVNTAARMESNGEQGKVNISNATYVLLKDDPRFQFEHRGKLEAKGKGKIDMWFVRPA